MVAGPAEGVVRIAAVGDLHYARDSLGKLKPLFEQVAEHADVLVLCGDLTDYGLVEEAQLLVKEIPSGMLTPIVAVLGNHDHESGHQDEVLATLREAVGIGGADAPRGAGDESRALRAGITHVLLLEFKMIVAELSAPDIRSPQRCLRDFRIQLPKRCRHFAWYLDGISAGSIDVQVKAWRSSFRLPVK